MSDSLNDEFAADTAPVEIPAKPLTKAQKAAIVKAQKEAEAEAAKAAEMVATPVVEIDPELDRANWPVIQIEFEDGKPNYEYVSAHGTLRNGQSFGHDMQIMRGVEVAVPPSIVYALEDSKSAHYAQRRNPLTGAMLMDKSERSSVPWRLVKGGKHLR